ncbi:MAG: DUF4258 domain-containing protein [Desulfomonilaceae bacterium]
MVELEKIGRVLFTGHALRRMFDRSITHDEVLRVLDTGEVIAVYPEDDPLPSRLILGFVDERPIHVVAALDPHSKTDYIVTAYDPDPDLWESDFRIRRSS